MNKWKKELQLAFEAPEPLGKREFLRRLEQPRMSVFAFLLTQIGYIRKWVWCVSVLIFAAAVIGAAVLSLDMLWGISALTPLLALTVICESGRSECYEMAELEQATRFSLRSVTLARLGILGVENLLLLCLLVPLGLWHNGLRPIEAGIYILTPFLLTAFLGLYIVRKARGREAIYACFGISICVSVLVFFAHDNLPDIYQEHYLPWWIAGVLALCVGVGRQYVTIVKRTEELTWNLS